MNGSDGQWNRDGRSIGETFPFWSSWKSLIRFYYRKFQSALHASVTHKYPVHKRGPFSVVLISIIIIVISLSEECNFLQSTCNLVLSRIQANPWGCGTKPHIRGFMYLETPRRSLGYTAWLRVKDTPIQSEGYGDNLPITNSQNYYFGQLLWRRHGTNIKVN